VTDMFEADTLKRVRETAVVAVLTIADANDAAPVARSLLAGGITAMELTLRTPVAIEALQTIRRDVPEMAAGVGTILKPSQVHEVASHGAAFGVAPGCNLSVIRAASEVGLSFAPGVAVPSDIETAVEAGCRVLKFFPAEPSGGLKYLQSIAAPYLHLDLEFLPLGGINERTMEAYLRWDPIAAVGGSWIASRDLIDEHNWDQIEANAARASKIAREARRG
jgi:2-dehydro-3-deoxyphosphogluconate aldolase/(4S)-4-hydroxy-2-oxoglutarate aldolase